MEEKKMQELNLDEMDKVSGGLIVKDAATNKYWVTKDDGVVVFPAPNKACAVDLAKALKVEQEIITLEEYKKRFGHELSR
jgi:hypothetical protein